MLWFDKEIVANSANHAKWWNDDIVSQREFFAKEEQRLMGNAAAILPRDAYIEMDRVTVTVMRDDGGEPIFRDLMALAKSVHIGKTVHQYRISSDINSGVNVSLGGQEPVPVDKTDYDYRKSPIPIFDKGYGRKWREAESLRSEGFDALFDDHQSTLFHLKSANVDYMLNGSTKINVDGAPGYGIRTSPNSKAINLGSAAGGANIDLTSASTTADAIINFFVMVIGKQMDDNYIDIPLNFYVSPEIMRNLDRPYSGSQGFKGGSIRDAILSTAGRRVAKIEQTFKMTGNQFVAFAPSQRFIRPIVGMATNTFAMPRLYPRADYHFMVNNAFGMEIVADWNGRSGVFYSTVVN